MGTGHKVGVAWGKVESKGGLVLRVLSALRRPRVRWGGAPLVVRVCHLFLTYFYFEKYSL